jgi:hypothetical protein
VDNLLGVDNLVANLWFEYNSLRENRVANVANLIRENPFSVGAHPGAYPIPIYNTFRIQFVYNRVTPLATTFSGNELYSPTRFATGLARLSTRAPQVTKFFVTLVTIVLRVSL